MEKMMVAVVPSDVFECNRQEGRKKKKVSSQVFLSIFTSNISFTFVISLPT